MYSVQSYGQMITDQVRMEPYVEALRRVIGPEKTVLDIGSGTGIIALLACQMGARHVYAIEPASAIEVAREVVAANLEEPGFDDVKRKVMPDFAKKNADVPEHTVDAMLEKFHTEAKVQVMEEIQKSNDN